MLISRKDKMVIRDLAKRQLELANSPKMIDLKKEWIRHNDCKPGRAMVTVEWGTFHQEVLPPLLKTKGKLARILEQYILSGFVGHELFDDDSVVKDYIGVPKFIDFVPFGMRVKVDRMNDSVGHHFVEQIKDLGEDFGKLKKS